MMAQRMASSRRTVTRHLPHSSGKQHCSCKGDDTEEKQHRGMVGNSVSKLAYMGKPGILADHR